jgi:phage terminase large subunit-like protein
MNYVLSAVQWAEDVVNGKEIRSKTIIDACNRFLDDLEKDWKYTFDVSRAQTACDTAAKFPHVKGKWAANKELFEPRPWQCFILCNLFGWVDGEGLRRFRETYIEIPRKNGKSYLAAIIGILCFTAKSDFGAEVYSGATSEKQAWEVFRPAKQICERLPELRDHFGIEVNAKSLTRPSEGSRFEPVIGKPGDGASPSCAIADEVHEHKTSDLIDTMQTGMGARDQSLLVLITTAGTDFGGPCRERRRDALDILSGSVEDETVFALIFTIDEDDEWDTEEAARKANPNYGISVSSSFLTAQLSKARRSSSVQASYKTKHLNVWIGAKSAWMNMLAFQKCKSAVRLDEFKGESCWIGLDLATKTDLAAWVAIFEQENNLHCFPRFYLPETAVYDGRNNRYRAWVEGGHITVTDGDVTDFDLIESDLIDFANEFRIERLNYDPWQASQMAHHLDSAGLETVECRNTVQQMSEPMKELEALILQDRFRFDGNPVYTWNMGNVVAKLDAKDNIYPNKEASENKIDGIVATIMALNGWIAEREQVFTADQIVA